MADEKTAYEKLRNAIEETQLEEASKNKMLGLLGEAMGDAYRYGSENSIYRPRSYKPIGQIEDLTHIKTVKI